MMPLLAFLSMLVLLSQPIPFTASSSILSRDLHEGLNIILVYHCFANVKNPHWQELVYEQLQAVELSGLLDVAHEFHIALTTGPVKNESSWEQGIAVINRVTHRAIINTTWGDHYEYDGIYKAWEVGMKAQNKEKTIVGYFHSKGTFNIPGNIHFRARSIENIYLTKVIIEDWAFYVDHFRANSNLVTAGLANTCGSTAQFHNFWWARASYLAVKEEPKYGTDIERHYYEFWLNTGSRDADHKPNSTLSICAEKYGKIPVPQPPDCDKFIKDGPHDNDPPSNMNNMKYAIICGNVIIKALDIDKMPEGDHL